MTQLKKIKILNKKFFKLKISKHTHLGHTSGWLKFRDFLDRNMEDIDNK